MSCYNENLGEAVHPPLNPLIVPRCGYEFCLRLRVKTTAETDMNENHNDPSSFRCRASPYMVNIR